MQDVRSRPKTSSKPRVETIRVSHYSVPRSISLGSVSSLTLPLAIISSEMSLSSLSKVQCLGCCVVIRVLGSTTILGYHPDNNWTLFCDTCVVTMRHCDTKRQCDTMRHCVDNETLC